MDFHQPTTLLDSMILRAFAVEKDAITRVSLSLEEFACYLLLMKTPTHQDFKVNMT